MSVKIDTDAVINNIFMTDQGSNPSTPSAGKTRIFSKADGIYIIDDDGLVVGPLTPADGWTASKLTWTWNSGNDPTYVIQTNSNVTGTFSAGMRFKVNDTATRMFIITKVAFSGGNTQLTMYGGTDYDLTSGTLTSPYYSTDKAPTGFPLDPTKWETLVTDTSERVQNTPNSGTWYNAGSLTISIPIGAWFVDWQGVLNVEDASATVVSVWMTLSTANNSESDTQFTAYCGMVGASSNPFISHTTGRSKPLVLTTATSYYLNYKTSNAGMSYIDLRGDLAATTIRARCAYL